LVIATGTTVMFSSRLESSRTSRSRVWLILRALASLMSPAIQASHTSGVSDWIQRPIATSHCTERLVAVTARPSSIAANSPGSYRTTPPVVSSSASRFRSAFFRASANWIISWACRACAFERSRAAAFIESTSSLVASSEAAELLIPESYNRGTTLTPDRHVHPPDHAGSAADRVARVGGDHNDHNEPCDQ
jgi:hypothetical protein